MLHENWLEDVGDICISTLDRLNAKAERGLPMTHQDKTSRDICLGYLFLLSICENEGIFNTEGISGNYKKNMTIH